MNKIVAKGLSEDQISIVKNTVAKGATDDELKFFLTICQRTGLDPFTKQIHFIKRKMRMDNGTYKEVGSIQTGIDGYRAIAEKSGALAGISDVFYDSEAEKHPLRATVTVKRIVSGQPVEFTATARWAEYAPINPKTGSLQGLWVKMPYLMLGKCAEALALRKAFPNDLSGLYTHEEMAQSENVVEVKEEKPNDIFINTKKLLEMQTNVKVLEAYRSKLIDSDKFPAEQKKELMDIIDKKLSVKKTINASETIPVVQPNVAVPAITE